MQFDFGRNWAEFSERALTEERVAQAQADFAALFEGVELAGRTFLDIGFGQGLSLLSAAALGAQAVGCDISETCASVLRRNARHFPEVPVDDILVVVGSILEADTQARVRLLAKEQGFEIVHAWGVLHHTGDMKRAMGVAAELVAPQGHLLIAVYNRHWSSPIWRRIKWLYSVSPTIFRRLMVAALYPVIWLAKLAVTRHNPRQLERGMDFYYDVVDWVGGYPYEYATAAEIQALAQQSGFECVRVRSPRVPTGCNEFLFKKTHSR